MPLYGVNKMCQQCVNSCKQWRQCTPVVCRFVSNQKKEDTLTSGEIGRIGADDDHN